MDWHHALRVQAGSGYQFCAGIVTLTHRPPLVRALRVFAALMLFVTCQGAGRTARAQTQWHEQRIEAAFLYNFAKFVEWPGEPGAPGSAPLTFCVLGDGPVQSALEEGLAGKAINGHALLVRQIARAEDAPNCQVAFIGWAEKKRLPAVLVALKAAAVLTVADFEQFASHAATITRV